MKKIVSLTRLAKRKKSDNAFCWQRGGREGTLLPPGRDIQQRHASL